MHVQVVMTCISLDFSSILIHVENFHCLCLVRHGTLIFSTIQGRIYVHGQCIVRYALALAFFILDV